MAKITEKKMVTVEREVVIGRVCDVCKKKIVGDYWYLSTHHHDWGNDSIESYEHYDLCSEVCIDIKLNEYLEDCKYSHTQAFELSQEYFREER